MRHSIEIKRYGFVLKFEYDKELCGFYWRAVAEKKEEIGYVDFSIMFKHDTLFVETSFTPISVEIYSNISPTKSLLAETALIDVGDWTLKFVNLQSSSACLQILAAARDSYDGKEIISSIDLTESKTMLIDFCANEVYDKLFVKKRNYSNQEIVIADLYLINKRTKKILMTDESLVKPEYENVSRKGNKIVFSREAPIWSFFSLKFYEN